MKRIKSALLPLLIIPCFSSCQNTTYTVNAEEMYDAFTMKGEKYLQANLGEGNYNAFTPNSYHHIGHDGLDYFETVQIKKGDKCCAYERRDPKSPFEPVTYEVELHTISEFVESVLEPISQKKYEDFHYHEDSKEYFVNYEIEYEGEHTAAIRFVDKKVTYFDRWKSDETREDATNFTFEHKEVFPPDPEVK